MNHHRLTLIASADDLTPDMMRAVQEVVRGAGIQDIRFGPDLGPPERVQSYIVHGITPSGAHPGATSPLQGEDKLARAVLEKIRDILSGPRVDVVVMPADRPDYKLFLADMDSTMLEGETLNDLAHLAGVGPAVSALTAAAMNGQIDYRESFIQRLALLKPHIGPDQFHQVIREQVAMPGGATLVATLKKHGIKTALVSGGYTLFTGPIGTALGFDYHHGNVLDLDASGRITGKIVAPFVHHQGKKDILCHYMADLGLNPTQTMAAGDGANDIPMLQTAGMGVAFHPKPLVREQILNQILYGDLTAILYAVGYARAVWDIRPDPDFRHVHADL